MLFRGDSTLLDETSEFSFKKILRRQFLTWVYGHVDYALYVGTRNKEYFLTHGLKPSQLMFAPHSIDNTRFMRQDSEAEASKWRAQLGLNKYKCIFLYAGKLTKKKAPEILIEAFLSMNEPAAGLLIAGNGELKGDLELKYGRLTNIHFIGFQNQGKMPLLYRLADIFVLPSRGPGETWGLALNEAMACGRGVIASDRCGSAIDLINVGENGYVFEADNVMELLQTMKNCMGKEEQFGRKSLDIIEKWNYSIFFDQLTAFFSHKYFSNEA